MTDPRSTILEAPTKRLQSGKQCQPARQPDTCHLDAVRFPTIIESCPCHQRRAAQVGRHAHRIHPLKSFKIEITFILCGPKTFGKMRLLNTAFINCLSTWVLITSDVLWQYVSPLSSPFCLSRHQSRRLWQVSSMVL